MIFDRFIAETTSSNSHENDSDEIEEIDEEKILAFTEAEKRELGNLLEKANQAEAQEDLDTAINKLQEYRRRHYKLKEEKRERLEKERCKQLIGTEKSLFEAEEIHGFKQDDIISPQDVSKTFSDYEADPSDIEIQSSPGEFRQLLENAQEVEENLGVEFKLVTRPALTIQEMAEQVQEKFEQNGWGEPVSSSNSFDKPFFSNHTPNKEGLYLLLSNPIPDSTNRDYLDQIEDMLTFIQEHALDVGIKQDIASACEEYNSQKSEIRETRSHSLKEASDMVRNLQASELLRPQAADLYSDAIVSYVKSGGSNKLLNLLNRDVKTRNEWDDDGCNVSLRWKSGRDPHFRHGEWTKAGHVCATISRRV